MKMRKTTRLLGMGLITVSLLLIGIYFYQRNEVAMCATAEKLFVQALKEEVQRKGKALGLFATSSGVLTDTLPLILHITTQEGVRTYRIDPNKSKKNISQNFQERSCHSVICEESGFSSDTLNLLWTSKLEEQLVLIKSAIRVSQTNLNGRAFFAETKMHDTYQPPISFIAYLGDRCEIEVCGFFFYSWFTVFLFHLFPFVMIVGIAITLAILFYFLFRAKKRLLLAQVSEECLMAEREREQQEKLVNTEEEEETTPLVYILSPELVFDADQRQLIFNGEVRRLSPQICTLLSVFLIAPDYTLTRSEISEHLWGSKYSAKESFRTTLFRLRKALSIDTSISIRKLDSDHFQLQLLKCNYNQIAKL